MLILLGVFLLGLYFVPSIVGRKKKNAQAIFVLNLLLGWTILGWIIALVWAHTKD
jgi:ABC-type Na+ efflux pump permease subunit